jgi:hypothetical protein
MGVHLIGVHLMSVYLINVYLTGVYLMSVHLTGVHLKQACSPHRACISDFQILKISKFSFWEKFPIPHRRDGTLGRRPVLSLKARHHHLEAAIQRRDRTSICRYLVLISF